MQVKWMLRLLVLLTVILAGVGCTGLAGEPEIVSTVPVRATSRPAVPETFDSPVSLERGALVFAENCVRCHGISGEGDGEFALSGQVKNVPNFTGRRVRSYSSALLERKYLCAPRLLFRSFMSACSLQRLSVPTRSRSC